MTKRKDGGRPAVRAAAFPWGQGALCGLLLALATPTAALAGGLLAPSLLMAWFDTEPGKPAARCMALSGLAAAVAPLASLWSGGHSMALAWSLLGDPGALIPAWAAQGGGWLLTKVLPLLLGLLQTWRTERRKSALLTRRGQLQAQWGIAEADADTGAEPDALPGKAPSA